MCCSVRHTQEGQGRVYKCHAERQDFRKEQKLVSHAGRHLSTAFGGYKNLFYDASIVSETRKGLFL